MVRVSRVMYRLKDHRMVLVGRVLRDPLVPQSGTPSTRSGCPSYVGSPNCILQVKSQESRIEGENPLPRPAGKGQMQVVTVHGQNW